MEHLIGHGKMVLAAMIAMILSGLFFIVMTDLVSAGKVDHYDHRVIGYLRHHRRPGVVEDIATDISGLGGPGGWLLVTGMVGGLYLVRGRYQITARLFGTISSGAVVTIFLKGMIDRVPPGQPDYLPAINYYPSFPSGHAMMATIAYLTIGLTLARLVRDRRTKIYVVAMSAGLVFLIGVTRVYLCIHWPTDVLAGWAAGLTWALLCWIVVTRIRQIRDQRKMKLQLQAIA